MKLGLPIVAWSVLNADGSLLDAFRLESNAKRVASHQHGERVVPLTDHAAATSALQAAQERIRELERDAVRAESKFRGEATRSLNILLDIERAVAGERRMCDFPAVEAAAAEIAKWLNFAEEQTRRAEAAEQSLRQAGLAP